MYWVWCTRRTGLWQSYTAIFSNLKDINWAALRAFVSGTQMLVMAFLFLNKVALIALHSEHRYFASIKNPTTSDRIVITSQSLYFKQTHFKRHINTITGRNITVRNGFWWNSGCKTPPLEHSAVTGLAWSSSVGAQSTQGHSCLALGTLPTAWGSPV